MEYPIAIVGRDHWQKRALKAAFGPRFVYLAIGESWMGLRLSGAIIYLPRATGSVLVDGSNREWVQMFKALKLMPGAKTVTIE